MGYLYMVTAPAYAALSYYKLGMTEEPYGRRSTYLTGCPPGLTPSHDLDYVALWKVRESAPLPLTTYEDMLHNQYVRMRVSRTRLGDSEWFNFQGQPALDMVRLFLATRTWIERELDLAEIPRPTPTFLRTHYATNTRYVHDDVTRDARLNEAQSPVIRAVRDFIQNPAILAGYVVAPCGSGKTFIGCAGMAGIVHRAVICCPSSQVQAQWYKTLVASGAFSADQILLLGTAGTTDPTHISTHAQRTSYCVVTTYKSCNLLIGMIGTAHLVVCDEAHHMAGVVSDDEGVTRRLLLEAARLGVKRLSLTFTPRHVRAGQGTILSMDDERLFGVRLAELYYRDLIHLGVLPDFRVWSLRDEARKGSGLLCKAACVLDAWRATECVRGTVRFMLHHMLVFAASNEDARRLEEFFQKTTNDVVIRVQGGDVLAEPLQRFAAAPRAILVNCQVLGEGVDIPIADSVAFLCPKYSKVEITQMVLRAGRWYPNKPLFHVLLPWTDREDLSGFEAVLVALASCDDGITAEIERRAATAQGVHVQGFSTGDDVPPERILIENYDGSSVDDIERCFATIKSTVAQSAPIQALCASNNVTTSVEYAALRRIYPHLPPDPRPTATTWYDYLNRRTDLSAEAFVRSVLEPNALRTAGAYDAWWSANPQAALPSVQHITDGVFGAENEFSMLLARYGTPTAPRRR